MRITRGQPTRSKRINQNLRPVVPMAKQTQARNRGSWSQSQSQIANGGLAHTQAEARCNQSFSSCISFISGGGRTLVLRWTLPLLSPIIYNKRPAMPQGKAKPGHHHKVPALLMSGVTAGSRTFPAVNSPCIPVPFSYEYQKI